MSDDIKSLYHMMDVNVYQENIFHSKMMLKDFDLKHYLFNARPEALSTAEKERITRLLYKEMQEIYYGRNVPEM
jgi:S-adenosylmethionine decarboxylase